MNNGNDVTSLTDDRGPMDCAEFRELLHELDRPGTPGAANFDSAMLHAEACGDCGVLLVEEESLGFALQRVARETSRMPGTTRIEGALLEEFRSANSQKTQAATISVLPLHKKITWQIVALGIAAVLLFLLGSVIYQRNLAHAPGTPSPSFAANAVKNAVPPAPAENSSVATAPTAAAGTTTAAKVVATSIHALPSADSEPTEYATAYVPLPYADDPSALEGGSVVRVTLARSTLAAYGLPVDGLEAGDRVTADMIVSEDGTPQAIRLVTQAD